MHRRCIHYKMNSMREPVLPPRRETSPQVHSAGEQQSVFESVPTKSKAEAGGSSSSRNCSSSSSRNCSRNCNIICSRNCSSSSRNCSSSSSSRNCSRNCSSGSSSSSSSSGSSSSSSSMGCQRQCAASFLKRGSVSCLPGFDRSFEVWPGCSSMCLRSVPAAVATHRLQSCCRWQPAPHSVCHLPPTQAPIAASRRTPRVLGRCRARRRRRRSRRRPCSRASRRRAGSASYYYILLCTII